LSVASDIPTLRQPDLHPAIEDCLREIAALAHERGFRVVHYTIQAHHLHLIVEASQRQALSRGMQGLAIRMARRINKVLQRRGKVFIDRYFERILETPKQTRNCLCYVLQNERRHAAQRGERCEAGWIDPCSSGRFFDGWRGRRNKAPPARGAPVRPAHSWLLSRGWRRHGLIGLDEVPGCSPGRRSAACGRSSRVSRLRAG
jgi:REP element-mobilizing transposase RayT